MRSRGAVREIRRVDVTQRPHEPRVQVAAVGQRTALAEAPVVEAIEKEPGTRLDATRLVDDAGGGRRADHHGRSLARHASCADVRACAVTERRPDSGHRLVRHGRQLRGVDLERGERLLVPRELVRVEEPAPARGRDAGA